MEKSLHDQSRSEDILEGRHYHPGHCRQQPALERPHKRPKLASRTLMDPPLRDSRSFTPHATNHTPFPAWTSSHGVAAEGNSRGGNRTGDALRRLHSDGEVSTNSLGLQRGTMTEEALADGETWIDFLRHSSATGRLTPEQIRVAREKAAVMAADRKRRLSEQQEDHTHRRSSSTLSIGQAANHRLRQSLPQATRDNPLGTTPLGSDTQPGQRNTDRPLPRRPSFGILANRRSQDFTLPRWQPDNEVSSCPICGTQFSLLWRRHHCRKCGRVVCASCSPHRITIPRQFIVRSPQELAAMQSARNAIGPNIVDLTGDSENTMPPLHRLQGNARTQNQDLRTDPALGGGQEVRLCNPCVPDPNPLPHLAYPSPTQYEPNPFNGGGRVTQAPNHSSPGNSQMPAHQEQLLARRISSDQLHRHVMNGATPNAMLGQFSGESSYLSSPTIDRRHSHTSRPLGSVPQPPNYPSIFGSAPEPPLNDVGLCTDGALNMLISLQGYIQSLLQRHDPPHPRHRHHVSTVDVPAHPRHRSMLDTETPPRPRPTPRPMLREEDECPICHSALPPKGPDGSETAREAHVTACIESHFSNSTPSSSHPPPATATTASIAANAATPSQAAAGPLSRSDGTHAMPRRRTTGMVVYHASEKDCIGEGGEGAQECVICFEEFAVGVEMGRLECLCKFHKVREAPVSSDIFPSVHTNPYFVGMHSAMVGYERYWGMSGASRRIMICIEFQPTALDIMMPLKFG